ncbi:MAG: CHAT domain-containing tetratricopeptide repeat protein [Bacteroidota bacterium]
MLKRSIILLSFFLSYSITVLAQNPPSAWELYAQKNYEAAIPAFDALLHIDAFANDSLRAEALHQKGISHYYLWELLAAIQSWEAESNILARQNEGEPLKLVKIHRNISSAYFELNRFEPARKQLQRAIELFEQHQLTDTIRQAEMYMMLGNIESHLGDYDKAELHFSTGLPTIEERLSGNAAELERAYSYLFAHFQFLEQPDSMIHYMEKALAAYESLKDFGEIDWILANCYNNLGIAHTQKEEWTLAMFRYEAAIEINKKHPERAVELGKNYLNLVLPFTELEMPNSALETLENARVIFTQENQPLLLAKTWSFEGDMWYVEELYEKALSRHQTALNQLTLNFNSDDIYEHPPADALILGDRPTYIEFLEAKAKAFVGLSTLKDQKRNLENAIDLYDIIAEVVDLMRSDFDADESKTFLVGSIKPIFEQAISAQLQLYELTNNSIHQERALDWAEQSKSTILLDAITKTNLQNAANIPEILIEEERALREEIAYLKQDIWAAEQANEDATEFRTALLQNTNQLEVLLDTLQENYPDLLNLRETQTAIDIAHLQKTVIEPNQALIQYFIGDSMLTTYYIDQRNYEVQQQVLPHDLVSAIETIRAILVKRMPDSQRFAKLSSQLYDWLLRDILKDKTDINRLLIVPDDVLSYLPFELLLTEQSESENFKSLPYLLRSYAISYGYSGSILAKQKEQQKSSNRQLAAFAPSYREALAQEEQVRLLIRNGAYDLPGARAEANAISSLVKGDLYEGEQATKSLFQDIANDYGYLHLSMHGLVEDDAPMQSRLLFYDDNKNAALHAYELYNNSLNAQMVVLSACNTGIGQLQKGEGVMSLAHAFTYAGVPSTVMSLWQVSDAATADILTAFYAELKSGQPKDVALQQAKLQYLEQVRAPEQAHPFFWGALLSYGDQSGVEFGNELTILWIAGLSMVALLLGFLYVRSNKKRSFS